MPVKLTCEECGRRFSVAESAKKAACPGCGTSARLSAVAGAKPPGTKSGVRCPMCKKTLPKGTKFCAACGVAVETADAGDAFVAGEKLEEQSRKDIGRWYFWARMSWLFRIFR